MSHQELMIENKQNIITFFQKSDAEVTIMDIADNCQ